MIQPKDIIEDVKKHRPLQRRIIEEGYKGIKVLWKLEFRIASEIRPGAIHISSKPINEFSPWVSFEVNKIDYPQLNILNEGQDIWVDGEISDVRDGYTIDLINCILKFEDSTPIEPKLNTTSTVSQKISSKVGILNTGKNNTFIGNTFKGLDVGIQDEGEGTLAKVNEFSGSFESGRRKWWERTWVQVLFILGAIAGIISLYSLFR